jgi:hypothetical protein
MFKAFYNPVKGKLPETDIFLSGKPRPLRRGASLQKNGHVRK